MRLFRLAPSMAAALTVAALACSSLKSADPSGNPGSADAAEDAAEDAGPLDPRSGPGPHDTSEGNQYASVDVAPLVCTHPLRVRAGLPRRLRVHDVRNLEGLHPDDLELPLPVTSRPRPSDRRGHARGRQVLREACALRLAVRRDSG